MPEPRSQQSSATLAFVRKVAGLTRTEREERAARDKERYHPANPRDYGSTIGMPVEDDNGNFAGYVCVGCWWCCAGEDGAQQREARAILRDLGEDY